ncbi:hypothetical protein [Streptomyces sp. LS1784]|uniref:hypothetical protein n=1 Tax=Streptomyces sp. LS1784 TaxID=2851533 RepID=UPI001CC94A4F|nr:hypothetical protein [Streptomyces sp. LS1784]
MPTAELESRPGPDGYPIEAWRALAARGRELYQEDLRIQRELGLLALRVAPGYVADRDAEEILHALGEEIGSSAEELAARETLSSSHARLTFHPGGALLTRPAPFEGAR